MPTAQPGVWLFQALNNPSIFFDIESGMDCDRTEAVIMHKMTEAVNHLKKVEECIQYILSTKGS